MDNLLLFSRSDLVFALLDVLALLIHVGILYAFFKWLSAEEVSKGLHRKEWLMISFVYIVSMSVGYWYSAQILKSNIWKSILIALISPAFGGILWAIGYAIVEALIDKYSSTCPACGAKGTMKRKLRIEREIEQLDETHSIAGPPEDIWGQTCKKCGYFIPDK